MRFGFLIGFVIAAAAASVIRKQMSGAPDHDGVLSRVKRHLDEVKEAGREAAAEKEAELRRELEDATGGQIHA